MSKKSCPTLHIEYTIKMDSLYSNYKKHLYGWLISITVQKIHELFAENFQQIGILQRVRHGTYSRW